MKMFDNSLHKENKFENFEENQTEFYSEFLKRSKFLEKYGFVHHIPILVGKEDEKKYKNFYETLCSVVKRIVLNYENDENVQNIIQLSDKAKELFGSCDYEYKLGTLRPDLLINKDMGVRCARLMGDFLLMVIFIVII